MSLPADNMLRSLLYAHFAESLSGLSTIRSYGEVNRFLRDNEYYIDLEDRAAFVTVTNQRCVLLQHVPTLRGAHAPFRWLAIRLDFLGGIMTFIVSARGPISQGCISNMVCQVAILAVSNASGIDPAQIGLVLTYTSTF